MLFSFLSYFSPSKTIENKEDDHSSKIKNLLESKKVLNHAILDTQGVLLQDFTLFHHSSALLIDLLIFLTPLWPLSGRENIVEKLRFKRGHC